jgi:hypothetical protein
MTKRSPVARIEDHPVVSRKALLREEKEFTGGGTS